MTHAEYIKMIIEFPQYKRDIDLLCAHLEKRFNTYEHLRSHFLANPFISCDLFESDEVYVKAVQKAFDIAQSCAITQTEASEINNELRETFPSLERIVEDSETKRSSKIQK
jgi:hypothetical protein